MAKSKDDIILQQMEVIRTMAEHNLNRMNTDFWGAPKAETPEKPGEPPKPADPAGAAYGHRSAGALRSAGGSDRPTGASVADGMHQGSRGCPGGLHRHGERLKENTDETPLLMIHTYKPPVQFTEPGVFLTVFLFYRPISFLTSPKAFTARSISSLVWPAEIWVRMRSLPLGTTG